MTSGVRRFTFSRAVVPLEIRFVLIFSSVCHLSAAKNLGLFWRPDGSKIVAKNVTRPSHKSYGLAGALLKMTQVRESGNAPQPGLFEQRPTRFFKGPLCDHKRGRRIRRA